jgi:hypothetical protein
MTGEVARWSLSKDVELTAEVNRYKLNICKGVQGAQGARCRKRNLHGKQGTSADRRRFGHTGRTILRRQTRSYGSWTAQTENGLTIAGKNWRGFLCKRLKLQHDQTKRRLTRTTAIDGSQSARVQEQKRCCWMHELGRDAQGLWFPCQPQRGPNVYQARCAVLTRTNHVGLATRHDSHAQVEHYGVQCIDWVEPSGRPQMGSARRQGPTLFVLRRRGQGVSKLL